MKIPFMLAPGRPDDAVSYYAGAVAFVDILQQEFERPGSIVTGCVHLLQDLESGINKLRAITLSRQRSRDGKDISGIKVSC
jgi:hypothetical protein